MKRGRPAMRVVVPGLTAIIAVMLAGCGDEPAAKQSTSAYGTSNEAAATKATTTVVPAADNTAKNAQDDGSAKTPLDQGMSEADTAITKAIRKCVMEEKGMSVNGQNVKIITKDGAVTLRGPVATEAERTVIVDLAKKVAGVSAIDNKLDVIAH